MNSKTTEMKLTYKTLSKINMVTSIEQQEIADFLFEHLQEYGDPKADILKAIDYALGNHPSKGGFVVLAQDGEKITGAVVVNHTNMSGYIPENILVYIAVDKAYRGQGIGKKLMQHTIDFANGDIALHVEPNNPAKILYEKIGFTNKYLEMRFSKKNKA